eukprot:s3386_g8.t1
MAASSLEDILGACGVEPSLASTLVSSGWTIENFACVASSEAALDAVWEELVPDQGDQGLPLLQKSALRAAYKRCRSWMEPAVPASPTQAAGSLIDAPAQSSWSESFAPKLDQAKITQLKEKFIACYPSELVNHDTMPSTRLLSLVFHQLQRKQWHWIPWKFRLTMAKADELSHQRQAKIPKLETASLHNLLVDEPPAIDISNSNMGVNSVRNLLAVHDMAVAMCGGAHLANLKAYSHKFLGFLTQRIDPDSMLRCASITESQSADRQIWGTLSDLMSERDWSMDDCLHEMTHVRHDLPGLLQLRPRAGRPALQDTPVNMTETPPALDEAMVSPLHGVSDEAHFALSGRQIFLDICSGATRPLSAALLALGGDVLSFDILLDKEMDLLNDSSYEQLLRVCSSGAVRYAAASPACAHYSRLKLLPGPGPRALRTPDALQGVPGLTATELLKVQESYMMLFRCITCLTLVYQAGGHVHLEQPPSAMSWLEDCVVQFLRLISAWCTVIAACAYGANWYKSWMFASSLQCISSLGSLCRHPAGSHLSIRGVHADTGEFVSRQTACYPSDLAAAFAQLVFPLLSSSGQDWPWRHRHLLQPIKGLHDPPFSQEDGGGLHSFPDWSSPHRTCVDCFSSLRKTWVDLIVTHQLDKRLLAYFSLPDHKDPPFSDDILALFQPILHEFLVQHGLPADWSIRDHQPMHLAILQSLSVLMKDPDVSLFPSLLEGVSTGFHKDIPSSCCMPPNDRELDDETPLSAHMDNWASADSDLPLTWSLVREEIDKGWIFEFEGSLEEAQQTYPLGISFGRLGIAHADGKAPRLVLDNSVCGLNSRCYIPDRSTLPSCKDILRTFPLRQFQGDHMGFSLDIKAAHKRIVLKDSEQGLVGFTLEGRLFFYRATSILDDTNPLQTSQRSQVSAGSQPKPSKMPPMVSDFCSVATFLVKSFDEIPCSLMSKLPHDVVLHTKALQPVTVPRYSRFLRFTSLAAPVQMGVAEGQTLKTKLNEDGAQQNFDFEIEVAFGLPWTYHGFIEQACRVGHPTMRDGGVPRELLSAVAKHVEWSDQQMASYRISWCRKRMKRAQELELEEQKNIAARCGSHDNYSSGDPAVDGQLLAETELELEKDSMEMAFLLTGWVFAQEGKKLRASEACVRRLVCSLTSTGLSMVYWRCATPSPEGRSLCWMDKQETLSLRRRLGFADNFLHGRLGKLVLKHLVDHAYGVSKYMDTNLIGSLRAMAERLQVSKPRFVSASECRQWFVYTDASYEPESFTGGLGGVLVNDEVEVVAWFGICLDEHACTMMGAKEKGTIIYDLEMLATVLATILWCDEDVKIYI